MRRIRLFLALAAVMLVMLAASAAPAMADPFDNCVLIGFTAFDEPVFACDSNDFFDETPGVSQTFDMSRIESGAASPSFSCC